MKVNPDMQSLRTLYAQKHLLTLTPRKFASRPSLLSSKISPCPIFPRHFQSTPKNLIHSTNHRHSKEATSIIDDIKGWTSSSSSLNTFGSENGKSPNVSATYGPIIGTDNNNDDQGSIPSNKYDNNPRSSSSDGEADSKKDRYYRKGISTSGAGIWAGGSKKKAKSKVSWVCSDCGYSDGQWWGSCRSCESVGTMKQFSEGEYGGGKTSGFSETVKRSWLPQQSIEAAPLRLTDVKRGMKTDWRFPLSGLLGNEVARALGGGLVPGSLVLIGGDPGVGKSTLMLQIAAILAEGHDMGQPSPVVYISGEESVEQIGNRADRMRIGTEELFLYSSTDVEDILEKSQILSPRALIIDSIQTVYLRGVAGSAGGLSQVKECTSALLRFAKKTNIPVLLTGHVTKTGDIAGPRVLEHIVDVVLYMEGEKHSSHRLLRTVKNRFGSTDELGVLEMSQSGLQAVSNPSEIFLSEQHPDSEILAGVAVAVTMEGSRSFLIEIQALCLACSSASRQVNGVPPGRANMIISVLAKQAGLKLQESGVYINVVSGYNLTETGGDLAIAAAICSSFLGSPIPNGVAFIGEIGLAGELRAVSRMEKRVNTVAKLGYRMCIVPKSAVKSLSVVLSEEKMEILGCQNLKEVINTVFTTP